MSKILKRLLLQCKLQKSIGEGLYKAVCVAKIDGVVRDLRTPIEQDAQVELLTFDEDEGKRAFWHTASHVMAQAVLHLFPNVKCAIGLQQGRFLHTDFDVEKPFSPEDLEKIEAEMKKIVKQGSARAV